MRGARQRRSSATCWGLLAVLFVAGAPVVAAEEKRPMTPIDMLEIPLLRDPRLAPDGAQLLYVLQQADWESNRRMSHIWRVNVDGSESIQLTNGADGERSPRWSPDGRQVAFLAKRGEDDEGEEEEDQIYLLANRGGEARRLTRHDTQVEEITWSPDGDLLYFLATDPKSAEQKEREEAQDDVYAFDEDYHQKHLWKVALADASEHRITEGDYSVLEYRLSRDGSKISFHRAPTPLFDDSDESEVWVMDSSGEGAVRLTHNTVAESGAELSPDNSQVLFRTGANAEFESYYNDNLFVLPASGGEHRMLLAEMPCEVDAASWSADGRSIYFLASTGVRSGLLAIDLDTEEARQLTGGDHATRYWSYDPRADQHVFTLHSATNAGDAWIMGADSTAPAARITHVFDYLGQEYLLPRLEAIQWPGADGTTVEGLLVYPLDWEPERAYPLVVQTHGGPASSDKFSFGRWRNYEPVLAAMGYAVFKPNYRGSTGYGDDFLRDMVGHYYRQSHLDVMTGVDHLIGLGIADGDRLVKMGWSAGGHMTNKIITHTDRRALGPAFAPIDVFALEPPEARPIISILICFLEV